MFQGIIVCVLISSLHKASFKMNLIMGPSIHVKQSTFSFPFNIQWRLFRQSKQNRFTAHGIHAKIMTSQPGITQIHTYSVLKHASILCEKTSLKGKLATIGHEYINGYLN